MMIGRQDAFPPLDQNICNPDKYPDGAFCSTTGIQPEVFTLTHTW